MNELLIPLDTKSKVPIYEQICDYIKRAVQQKHLIPGEKLPSSRAFARCLAVSRSTVDLAYDQLVSEGYIESIPCKGYYICEIDSLYVPGRKRTEEWKTEKENPSKRAAREQKTCAYDFSLNGIAPGGFPHNVWKKLARQVLSEDDDTLFQLGNPWGEYGFRSAVAEYLYQAIGMRCRPEQILIGAGNDYLLMLLGTILGKNRVIAMEDHTYLTAYYDFLHIGYEVKAVKQDESGMCISSLKDSGAQIAYVMPSHQFPAGTVMPLKRRMALLDWAEEAENRYIIEDDYDSEFRYRGKPIPALQGFDRGGRVIYMGTFSKSIAPSIRVSYMVLPEFLAEQYAERKSPFSVTVSRADQKILELFLKEGGYERHLNRMRAVYKSKHDKMVKVLRDMGDICTFSGEYAGLHLVLEFTNGLTEEEAVLRAEAAGVQVYGYSEYGIESSKIKKEPERKVLLGYACMTEEEIEKAMRKLKEAWE